MENVNQKTVAADSLLGFIAGNWAAAASFRNNNPRNEIRSDF